MLESILGGEGGFKSVEYDMMMTMEIKDIHRYIYFLDLI